MSLYTAIIAGVTSWLLFRAFYRIMNRLKHQQPIYELAPAAHQTKQVPTLGGIIILVMLSIHGPYLWPGDVLGVWVIGTSLLFGFIGLIDDGLSLWRAHNQGLTLWQKLIIQMIAAGVMLGLLPIPLSPLGLTISWLSLVSMSNAANLTDGLDGLLAGISSILMLVLAVSLGGVWWLFLGIILGFWLVNYPPAHLFMGDTGSLAIGAALGSVPIVYYATYASPASDTGDWLIIITLSLLGYGLFVAETVSVIIQVFVYKLCKKRVFLMAPLHHHLELKGYSERQIMLGAIILQLIFCLFCIFCMTIGLII